jgi:hypothetical protein
MQNSNIGGAGHSNEAMIAKIAEALDCPVDDFFDARSNPTGETADLLSFWAALEDARERRGVLDYIRAVAVKSTQS